jgi:hypothetical protein
MVFKYIDGSTARTMLLRAVRVRAAARDDAALDDIVEALADLDEIAAQGAWLKMVRKAAWLVERAEGEPLW